VSEPVYVSNPYLAAIKAEKSGCAGDREALATVLDHAISYLPDAWQGGRVDELLLELIGMRQDAVGLAEEAVTVFDDAIGDQDEWVVKGSWPTRWRNQ